MTNRILVCRTSDHRFRIDGILFVSDLCVVTVTDLDTGEIEEISYTARGAMKDLDADFEGVEAIDLDYIACCA